MRERIPVQNRLRLPLLGASAFALLLLVLTLGYRIPTPPWLELSVFTLCELVMFLFLGDIALHVVFEPARTAWARNRVPELILIWPVLFFLVNGFAAAGAGLVIAREGFVVYRLIAGTRWFQQLPLTWQFRPTQQVALAFLVATLLGTYLLTIPAATLDGKGTPFIDALFTSTAAICVTGLTVRNTGSYFSPFGQMVILVLFQAGGLGIMTLSTSIALIFQRKLGFRTRAMMQNIMEEASFQRLTSIILYIVKVTLVIELVGAIILFLRWRNQYSSLRETVFYSVFHSVSAFCNAGFTLFSESLLGYQEDWVILLTISFLVILGGLGFAVLAGFINADPFRRGWRPYLNRMSTHTKLALVMTFFLLVGATLYIFFFEFDSALQGMDMKTKVLTAFFHSVTLRTAGFNTVELADCRNVTVWLMILWMFVGGCPSSTAGGIKATTVGILVLSVRAMLLGREEVELYGRTIPKNVVYKAIAVASISVVVVTVAFSLLLTVHEGSFVGLLFESVSAFANVGLSLGETTSRLGVAGKLIIIFLMYVGRIGPLTLALAVGERTHRASLHYPEARILVG